MTKTPKRSARVSIRTAAKAAGMVAASALCLSVLVRPTEDAVANGDTRSLTLEHMHTGESLDITFKRNGQYDKAALEKLNWFLRDWRRKEPTRMDPRLFDTVWLAYKEVNASQPIHVLCGYRAPETNEMLRHRSRVTGVAKFSQHTLGKAMDFYIPGVSLTTLRVAGLHLQRGGVGFYPTSGSPFVHMDAGSVRMWPRMSRSQLASVFPDGKTVYLPAEGGKMPRYQEAFAEVLRNGGSVGGFQGAGGEDDGGGSDAPASSPVSLIASLFGGGRGAADTAQQNARIARSVATQPVVTQPVAAQPVVVAALDRKADSRAANLALAALAGPAEASSTAARSVVAMNDTLDDIAQPVQPSVAQSAQPVALPVPAPARPAAPQLAGPRLGGPQLAGPQLAGPQLAGPQLAWTTGAQPLTASVPLPPVPAPRAQAPMVALVSPPLPPTRPAGSPAPVQLAMAETAPAEVDPAGVSAIPAPPMRPRLPVIQPGKPVTAAVASLSGLADLPRQFLQGARSGAVGTALGYAAPEVVALARPAQPAVELVAARFEQIDFSALAAPVKAARNHEQTELFAPDLAAATGLMQVAYRIGPQRLALQTPSSTGFAGTTLASVN